MWRCFCVRCAQTLVFWAWKPFFKYNGNRKYDLWVPIRDIMTCDMNIEDRERTVTLLVNQPGMGRAISLTFWFVFFKQLPKATKETMSFYMWYWLDDKPPWGGIQDLDFMFCYLLVMNIIVLFRFDHTNNANQRHWFNLRYTEFMTLDLYIFHGNRWSHFFFMNEHLF